MDASRQGNIVAFPSDWIAPIMRAGTQRVEYVDWPLDKISGSLYEATRAATYENTLVFLPGGRYVECTGTALDPERIPCAAILMRAELVGELDEADLRLIVGADALRKAGQCATPGQLYAAIGGSGSPNPKQVEAINCRMERLANVHIWITNAPEAREGQYALCDTAGPAIPWQPARIATPNGHQTAGYIWCGQSPLMIFARSRRQVTTIPIALLQGPGQRMNAATCAVQQYILCRVRHWRAATMKANKVLWATLYERARASGKLERQRAREAARAYMDYLRDVGEILSWSEARGQQGGITFQADRTIFGAAREKKMD